MKKIIYSFEYKTTTKITQQIKTQRLGLRFNPPGISHAHVFRNFVAAARADNTFKSNYKFFKSCLFLYMCSHII